MGQHGEQFPLSSALSSPRSKIAPSRIHKLSDIHNSELAQATHHSSFALVPAVLTPSRAPSNALIASSRTVFFEEPILLDFASGWAKGPILEWYERQRNNSSTLIKKLQLRRDFLPPYYHEYIVVFTQGRHTYRVDRRPYPDSPFDTIMRAGCKPYDTVQAVESRSWREIENTSDCLVELTWYEKPKVDLLFLLSVCFALRQDEQAKQYTLQRYNCYFLSWAIIMMAIRVKADWETKLGDVMSEPLQQLQIRQKKNYCVVPGVGQERKASQHVHDAFILRQHLKDYFRHHMELELVLTRALARMLVWIRPQLPVTLSYSPDFALALTLTKALDTALNPSRSLARALLSVLAEVRKLVRRRTLLQAQKRVQILGRELEEKRERVLTWRREWVRGQMEEKVRGYVREQQIRERELIRKLEWKLYQTQAQRRGLELNLESLLDRALALVHGLKLHLVRLLLRQSAVSKLLFPADLYKWQSMMWDKQVMPLTKPSEGLSEHVLAAHRCVGEEAEELARSMQFTTTRVIHHPGLPSITLDHNGTNPDKTTRKTSNTCKATYPELERYMMKVLANHARRVARWGLASAAEVEHDMLKGMERIWLSVSQHSVYVRYE